MAKSESVSSKDRGHLIKEKSWAYQESLRRSEKRYQARKSRRTLT